MSVAPSRARVLDPQRYHASFVRSVRSELRKLTNLRSFWIQSGAMVIIYALIMWAVGASQNVVLGGTNLLSAQAVTTGISFIIIIPIVIGAGAVTNEYSSNTMRTTVLADSSRSRSYFAKLAAVGIVTGALNLVVTVVSALSYMIVVGGRWDFGDGNGRALVMFWAMMTVGAVMATSLGYIIRSTAGTITVAMLFLFVSQAIVIINLDWVRETLVHYMPVNVLTYATSTGSFGNGDGLSWSTAGIAWVVYAVVIGILGLIRYRRSDI
ncbi:ABC transporter permease [Actinomycetaceae bacterium L2_0104]